MAKGVSPERYDLVAQCLHWSMAIILIYLVVSSSFEDVPDAVMEQRIQLHSGLGLTIVGLGIVRWIWRFVRPRPAPISAGARWQDVAANVTHQAFYALLLLSPALGFLLATLVSYPVRPFGVGPIFRWPENSPTAADFVNSLHGFAADVILVLVIIHAAAALYHQFIKREAIIARMLPRI